MDLEFNEVQRQVREAARRFLGGECPPALVRSVRDGTPAHPQALWAGMAAQGWLALPFELDSGAPPVDAVTLGVVVEELGRACDPTAFIDCVVSCGGLIQDAGTDAQRARWLAAMARGELLVSLASLERPADPDPRRIETRLESEGMELRLSGRKLFVEHAADADLLLVPARVAGSGMLCLVLVSPKLPGIELVRLRSFAHPHLYEVRLDRVAVDPSQLLGGDDRDAAPHLEVALRRTAAFLSVAAAGGAQRVLEMAVAHARERHQFGRPIGSFQAVQHLLADAWADVESARLAAYEALTEFEWGHAADARVGVARCASSESFVRTCLTAHQVFGGMGYMWETDLHLWTRKAKEIEFACGGPGPWRRKLAGLLSAR